MGSIKDLFDSEQFNFEKSVIRAYMVLSNNSGNHILLFSNCIRLSMVNRKVGVAFQCRTVISSSETHIVDGA